MMNMSEKIALYARVSTENQNLERQKEKLTEWVENEDAEYDLYSEKASSIKERPEFEKIMENIEEYDYIVVTKIDRFARSIQDFIQRITKVRDAHTEFKAIDQPINTDDEIYGDFLLNQLVLFAELERKMIRRRLEEGYKDALEDGRVGRPEELDDTEKEKVAGLYERGASWEFLIDEFEVSKGTIRKALREKGVLE